jgi:hypothetical protein
MWLRRVAAVGAAASLLAAPKLWVTTGRLFPPVPVSGGSWRLPFPADYVLFALALAALAGWALSSRRAFPAAFLVLAALLVALDQSRLQPWLIEYAVMAGAMLAGAATPATRLFFVGLYAFAGLHKLNYGFVMLLAEMLQPLWQPGPKVLGSLAVVAALWEGGWGVALAFRRTRRIAALALIAMHLALLALLGPWALNLNRSVWAWNVVNIVVLALLFWRDWNWKWDLRHTYVQAVGLGTALAGLLALAGVVDAYAGFGLYSGHTTSGALYVDPKRVPDLPEPVRHRVKPDGVLDLNLWSVQELGAPVYPEPRIYRAVGRQVAVWLRWGDAVRVIEFSRPDWFTGQRQARSYDPLTQ